MKKLTMILAVTIFSSALAIPVFARGYGMGRGGGMIGGWGSNPTYCDRGGSYYQEPNQSDRDRFYQGPEARPWLNDRFGREYRGGHNFFGRGSDSYNHYDNMGRSGMGWRK